MSYENLLHIFNAIYPVNDALKQAIITNSEMLNVNRKTLLLQHGKHCNHIYFIVSGAARVFYIDKNGDEVNTWFLFENELLISVHAFFLGQPSQENIETLEDCVLIALHRSQLEKLYNEFIEFNFIGRKLTEHYYVRNEEQTNNHRHLSAGERYQELFKNNPQIFRRVSLGNIASYLGISKETLSRIRKRKL